MLEYKVGDPVHHLVLKQHGIISACVKPNVYKVSIGSMEVVTRTEDLRPRTPSKETRFSKSRQVTFHQTNKPKETLDLHGQTVEQAKEQTLQFISSAVVGGLREVKIIHGHGSGAVKQAVHETLASLSVVASFRHEINNLAVTKVYLC